jgi:uncharacterized phage protein (TIGR01671 family)
MYLWLRPSPKGVKMREIKFRLLNDNKIVGYLRLKDGWTQFQAIGRNDWYYPCNFKWTDAEQYTGLKDKNGVEIYEGDIVMYDIPYQVYWAKARVGFWCVNNKKCREFGINDNIEVIGNIHQNPELQESK